MIELAPHIKTLTPALEYAATHSPYYKRVLGELQKNGELTSENWTKIPFTTKEDVAQNNTDFLCVPMNEVADFVTTSGSTGNPITLFLTKNDLKRLGRNERDSMVMAGVKKGDLLQLMTTIDRQFMAGMAYYLGAQELNAGIIRIGPGVPELQWNSILTYKPNYLIAVPSFLLTLIGYAKQNGIDLNTTSVKGVICIGEAIRTSELALNVLGERIVQDWNIELYSTYASTEMATAFTECVAQNGCHLNEELLYLEVLKENGEPAKNGEVGEIVITTLGVEGMPFVRYKTSDLATIYTEPCSCGRNSVRLGPIIGRKNQMIKYKGTTVFPQAIFELLDSIPAISCYKVLVKKDEFGKDDITLLLEEFMEEPSHLNAVKEKCSAQLKVIPNFEFVKSDYLRSQVFKRNLRKPEKISFL